MVSVPSPGRARGFTLTELLAAVAVAAILSALAAPSLRTLAASMRTRGTAGELYAGASRARSEAIKRNKEVSLSPITSGQWQAGWNIPDPDGTNTALDTHPAVQDGAITGPASLTFLPNGRLKGGGDAQFDVSVSGSSEHRCIRISLSGMPSQTKGACTTP